MGLSAALPTELHPHVCMFDMVETGGLEPPTGHLRGDNHQPAAPMGQGTAMAFNCSAN